MSLLFQEYLSKYNTDWLGLLISAAGIYAVGVSVHRLFFAPLSKLPGTTLSKLNAAGVHLSTVLGKSGDEAEEDYFQYGDIYRVGPKAVVICNPADCRKVLATHRFKKSLLYQNFALVDDDMFTTQSAELAQTRRKQIGPVFTQSYIANMEPTIIENGIKSIKRKWDGLLEKSEGGQIKVQFASHFSMATFDVIGGLGYGQHFSALENGKAQVVDWVKAFTTLAQLRILYKRITEWPAMLFTRKLVKEKDDFVAFANSAVEKRRAQLRDSKDMEKPKDLLQALIDGEDPDSKVKMTPTQITAENIVMLIAGTDTTSLTMTWILHYLMLYPDYYKRVVDEVRSAFSQDHIITFSEGKSQLPFLDAFIYEALRVRAVAGVPLPRIVPEGGATFQGHFLPAGTQIGVNITGANHHLGTWENPHRFWPERFIENEKLKQSIFTFSGGARICPGRNLAQYEITTILANILKDYDFRLPEDSLFGPDKLNKHGYPMSMPRTYALTVGPKYPDRDCQILVSKASS